MSREWDLLQSLSCTFFVPNRAGKRSSHAAMPRVWKQPRKVWYDGFKVRIHTGLLLNVRIGEGEPGISVY